MRSILLKKSYTKCGGVFENVMYKIRLRKNDVLFSVKCLKPQCAMRFILSYRQMRGLFLRMQTKMRCAFVS